MLLHAFGILCGLSVVVFAAVGARPRAAIALVAAFIGASLTLSPVRFPDPSWIAAMTAVAGGLVLWRPRWSVLAAGCGGIVAAVWVVLLQAQGLPTFAAYAGVIAMACVSAVLAARRKSFAPARLQEEALMIVVAFALIVAAAPSVSQGFDSAVALTAVRLSGEASPTAPWALITAAACAVLGGLFSLWRRR